MIVYLDTSALVKAYISEEHSKQVLTMIQQADIVASHLITFIEAHAAFFRLKREKKINEKEFSTTKNAFVKDWENYLQIETSKPVIENAIELSEAFALRAYDSVHLAAAVLLFRQSKQPVLFACFDQHLNKAAKVLGLDLLK